MNDITILPFSFPAVRRKKVTADFDGGRLTSDGGVMLLPWPSNAWGSRRGWRAAFPILPIHSHLHTLADMIRARVFAIACGYEDANDLEHLRKDPAFKHACGRLRIPAWTCVRSRPCRGWRTAVAERRDPADLCAYKERLQSVTTEPAFDRLDGGAKSVPVLLAFSMSWHGEAEGMFTVELYAKIRCAVLTDGMSRRGDGEEIGVHRNTISKMLHFRSRLAISGESGLLQRSLVHTWRGSTRSWRTIAAFIQKQRHTAHRIFDRLRGRGRILRRIHDRARVCRPGDSARPRDVRAVEPSPRPRPSRFRPGRRLYRRQEGRFHYLCMDLPHRRLLRQSLSRRNCRGFFATATSRRLSFSAACRSPFYTITPGSQSPGSSRADSSCARICSPREPLPLQRPVR